jgi:hypothetical protein
VAAGAYVYYRLDSSTFGQGISVTVTPLSGDPDVYVSSNSSNVRPTSAQYNKAGVGSGVETVLFQWSAADLPECLANVPRPGDPYDPNKFGSCAVFIGVYGWTNASFTVVADLVGANGTSLTELVDGQPQGVASLAGGTWAYFYARVSLPATQTYSVYVRSRSGDPDLYVATDGLGPPTQQRFQYSSTSASGDEFVNVAPGTRGYNSSTTLYVGVFAFGAAAAAFDVTFASASAVVALAPGVAASGLVAAGQYAYYSFAAPNPALTLTWTLTALGQDPDIYIGVWRPLAQRYRPTVAASTWRGEDFGSDSVAIAPFPLDPNACPNACTYIAGVFCSSPTGSCRFMVSAAQGSALTQLADGVPVGGSVANNSIAYYGFSVAAGGRRNVTVRAAASLGSAQLWVSAAYDPFCRPGAGGPTACAPLPSPRVPGSFAWASSADGV